MLMIRNVSLHQTMMLGKIRYGIPLHPKFFKKSYSNSSQNPDQVKKSVPAESKSTEIKSTEYIPQTSYQRVTYQYPPPPEEKPFKPVESSPFRRHIPMMVGLAGVLWAIYAYKYIYNTKNAPNTTYLDPESFTPFKITYREDLTPDTFILELSPRYSSQLEILRSGTDVWNGKKLWSVEIRQPQLQIVRKYTPIPVFYQQYKDGQETKVLRRLLGSTKEYDGRMVLLIKKYEDGEVSRYLHGLSVGDEVELRGPHVGFRYPYSPIDGTPRRPMMDDLPSRMPPEPDFVSGLPAPENTVFFAGGTGIAPILQSLFSQNPPRGFVHVYYSVRDRKEIPFSRFMFFLEKAGRAKFHYYVDNEGQFLQLKDIPTPQERNYSDSKVDEATKKQIERELKLQQIMQELRKEKELAKTDSGQELQNSIEPELSVNNQNSTSSVVSERNELVDSVLVSSLAAADKTLGKSEKYRSVLDQTFDKLESGQEPLGPSIAIVCGPEGYINYVAGPRGAKENEAIRGLLGEKGWNLENTHRMES